MTEHLNCIRLCGACVMPQDSQHSNNNKILMSQSTFYQMFYLENWISDTTALISCCLSLNFRTKNRNTKKNPYFRLVKPAYIDKVEIFVKNITTYLHVYKLILE